jgi:hypothetical protein
MIFRCNTYINALVALLIALPAPSYAAAENLSATTLQKYCAEMDKGALGAKFNAEYAQLCTGYIDGFFDSMIIVNMLSGKQFCLPTPIPRIKHTKILDAWIDKNQNIAPKTTASVALYSALKTAFPCPKHERLLKR